MGKSVSELSQAEPVILIVPGLYHECFISGNVPIQVLSLHADSSSEDVFSMFLFLCVSILPLEGVGQVSPESFIMYSDIRSLCPSRDVMAYCCCPCCHEQPFAKCEKKHALRVGDSHDTGLMVEIVV